MMMGALLVLATGVAVAITKTCSGTDWCYGTSDPDTLTGNAKDNKIDARGGNDRIEAQAGADLLVGAEGNDKVYGGQGNDRFRDLSENGYLDSRGNDILEGGYGDDTMNDRRSGDRDQLYGRTDEDILDADDGANTRDPNDPNHFDPQGANLDYVDGGSAIDVCKVDAGDTYLNCQRLFIDGEEVTATATTAVTDAATDVAAAAQEEGGGVVLADDDTPRTAPDSSSLKKEEKKK
jgi:Ca2+-binding RTX toxin-like protein